jgi:predicted ribosomally synthesized peptide with nif11-like leader
MSAVDDFRSKLASDSKFADAVKGCKTADEITKVALGAGITLSHADLARALAAQSAELSDADLESVSSGTVMAAALVK